MRALLILSLVLFVLPGRALAADPVNQTCGKTLTLTRSIDGTVCSALETLISSIDRKPTKKIYLARQRAEADAEQIRALLISEGFYGPDVKPLLTGTEDHLATFQVDPGTRFKISAMTITYDGEGPLSETTTRPKRPGKAADIGAPDLTSPRAKDIVAMERSILAYLRDHGYPWASLAGHQVKANFETATATVDFIFTPGPLCTYGDLEIKGANRLDAEFISALVSYRKGKPCSLSETEDARAKLSRTGLFAATEVKPQRTEEETGENPIVVRVKEAKARTVGLGFSYATNRGLGARAYWEHRNLLGRAERLHIELNIEEIKQEGEIAFRKPLPESAATVFAALTATTEALEAYDATRYKLSAGVDHPLWGPWHVAYSLELEAADIEDQGVREKGETVTVPIVLTQSTVDDPLDTADGVILSLAAAPAYSTFGEGAALVKLDGRIAYHLPLGGSGLWDFSTWAHAGSLLGGSLADIPATKLYYGGGSKSVRAIAWEHLSALDSEGVPTGGRTILEGGVELRASINPTWQVVGFIEGGRVYRDARPDFDEDILWGGGFGIRYKTPIGPLRLDIALPFDPRPGDEEVLFYIGLGQAF